MILSQRETIATVYVQNVILNACRGCKADVYSFLSIAHVFAVRAGGRLCLWVTPSLLTHDWCKPPHMGLSLSHIWSLGGQGKREI